jgi:hypothetical protein
LAKWKQSSATGEGSSVSGTTDASRFFCGVGYMTTPRATASAKASSTNSAEVSCFNAPSGGKILSITQTRVMNDDDDECISTYIGHIGCSS